MVQLRDDRGAVAILTAVLMLGLIGLTAFVVDLGNNRQNIAEMQTAADTAALSGIRQVATGDDPTAVVESYIALAGFDTSEADVNYPPTSGDHVGDTNCVEVVVRDEIYTYFGVVLGRDSVSGEARAVACAQFGGAAYPAMWADGTCGDKSFKISGGSNTINGAVHSNDEIDFGDSSNDFNGAVTYVNNGGEKKGQFEPGSPSRVGDQDLPFTFDIADYQPGGARAVLADSSYYNAGNNKIDIGWLKDEGLYNDSNGRLDPGLYYTRDDIDLGDSDMWSPGGVTFVSRSGNISFSGSDQTFTPWDPDGLLAFTNDNEKSSCGSEGIEISGSNNTWEGLIYAPRSTIKLNGSDNLTLEGSVVAWALEVSGAGMDITNYTDSAGGTVVTNLKE